MPDSVTQILESGPPGREASTSPCSATASPPATRPLYNNKVAGTPDRRRLRPRLLLRGRAGVQHLSRQPDLERVRRSASASTTSTARRRTPATTRSSARRCKNTALGYIFSGSWAHCWLEGGANTGTLVQNALNTWVPDYDLVRHHPQRARLWRLRRRRLSDRARSGVDWTVMAHEFGHGTGGAGRRVLREPGTYSGGEPGSVERHDQHEPRDAQVAAASSTRRRRSRPAPAPARATRGRRAGRAGATTRTSASSRAAARGRWGSTGRSINCRMRGNSPPYCPVCYTQMKRRCDPYTQPRS